MRLRLPSPPPSALLLVLGGALAVLSCSKEAERELPRTVVPDALRDWPGAEPARVAENPTAPAGPGGSALPWPAAPELVGVQVVPNRDSAVLLLPVVEGARDYRAFALVDGVGIAAQEGGTEQVLGAVVHCAGYRQHNAAARAELELLRQLELGGLTGEVRVVVEAVDAACPFPGVRGAVHERMDVTFSEVTGDARGLHEIYTEDEIRARYGSLVVNGHGPGPRPGAPAEPVSPRVLARTTVVLAPRAPPVGPTAFFDGFEVADPPRYVGEVSSGGRAQFPRRYQNGQWNFYTYGAELTQFFIDHGQLHMVLADWHQDVFATNVAYPRRPAQLHDESYLHVRFDVASNSTSRRYWWMALCGAATPGATMDADGALLGDIIQTPFFQQPDGRNPSVQGWNCLQFFPRDGWPFTLPPDKTRPESDIRVMVNRAGAGERESVVNVSPDQYNNPSIGAPSWFRQQHGTGPLLAPMLDDQLLLAPRTRLDAYVRRDRLVLFVNGEQRLCNDFPTERLTMAEAAVGFGQVLYHSAAERLEFNAPHNDRSGQHYYLHNTPFMDVRSWDNLGVQENVAAPEAFDPAACYVHGG